MRRLIWPVLFLFLFFLQASASVFYTGWLSFDLLLLALYAFALLRGEKSGAAAGFCVGLVQDAMTVGVFGFHIITRIMAGYIIGFLKEKIFRDNVAIHMLVIAVCSFAIRFFYWWIALFRSGWRWEIFSDYAWTSLGFIVGNVILVYPITLLVYFVYNWIKEDDISY